MKMVVPMDLLSPGQNPKGLKGLKKDLGVIDVNGIGNLPRDLIIEILSRVPVKVLCKFRCVSKQWLNLLSYDKQFITQHAEQAKSFPLLLFRKYHSCDYKEQTNENKVVVELTTIDSKGEVISKILAPVGGPIFTFTSCGPLVLLCCPYRVYVCNPTTQEFLRIPLSTSVSRYCTVGFGHISSSNEYKIVHLYPNDSYVGDEELGCEIFTLKNGRDVEMGSWRRIAECPYKVRTNGLPVCVNGFVYWMVSEEDRDLNSSKKSILSFDLEKEEFGMISYPKFNSNPDVKSLFLNSFKSSLCLVDSSSRTTPAAEIWMLKDGKKSIWVKNCSINLSGFDPKLEIRGVVPLPEGSADEKGQILINTEQQGLMYYNLEGKSFTRVKSDAEEHYKLPCVYYNGFFSLSS